MVRRKNDSDAADDDKRPTRRKQWKRTDNNDDEPAATVPTGTLQIRNKMVRQLLYAKLKRSKSKTKLQERKARQESDQPREEPKTIEKKRSRDETWVDENDQETLDDISNDELNTYFTRQTDGTEPKLLLTSQEGFPTSFTNKFLKELSRVLPNTTYFQRRHHPIKRIIKKMNQLG
jgi:exopolysaccharide biosynthesis protein